jgi:transposase
MREWIITQLALNWRADDFFVLDNSNVHKSKLARDTFTECGIAVLYLPRDSQDFNPIELMWANVKSRLKKAKARTQNNLDTAFVSALNSVKLDSIKNWFNHCGYSL